MARTIIPFGPQHPVLPEPIHLDLVVEDEKVVEARPSIGFVHRGLEKLVEKKDYIEFVYIAERICGICSFIHGQTYCQAIEAIMNIPVPPRAHYLRTVWGELSRLHSHLLWLGLMADGMGFESLFMHSWRVRERVLNIIEATTGGRVIFGSCKIGGVRRDMDADAHPGHALAELDDDRARRCAKSPRYLSTTIRSRSACAAWACCRGRRPTTWAASAPCLRASGVAQDMRQLGYAAYQGPARRARSPAPKATPMPVARCVATSCSNPSDLIRQALAKIPPGEIAVKVTGNPNGEVIMRTEQPRGEVVYCLKANGAKNLQRFRVRTPTFANLPAHAQAAAGLRPGRRARAGADH